MGKGDGVASDVPSKTDLIYEISYNPLFIPKQFRKVSKKEVTIEGEKKYFIKNLETGGLYDFTEFAVDVWNLIDGQRTLKDINEAMRGIYKDFKPDMVKEALLYFANEELLESAHEPVKKKRINVVSALMVRVCLIWNSEKFIRSIEKSVRPLLKRWLLWPVVIFVAIMGLLFAGNFASIFVNKENFQIMGSSVVGFFFYYFIVLGPVIAIHEIAHGVALAHYGGAPGEMGTGLYFFGPMFYIEVTEGWTLKRLERIMIFAAGPLSTFLIGALIMVAQYVWSIPEPANHILTMAVFYCYYGLLADLSPLLETDGYNILCDILRIPDLRQRAFGYMKTSATGLFRKDSDKKKRRLAAKTKLILVVYAALAAVWAVYLVYRSLTIVTYMAQDTATSVLSVSSAILSSSPVTIAAVVLSVASVLYFSMVMSGYGLLVFTSLKKALKTTLKFEEIHDRKLALFVYLPKNMSQSIISKLRQKMAKLAKSCTKNFTIQQLGSMLVVELRMSSARLAFVQIKEHFRKVEDKFSSEYERFLNNHRKQVLESVAVEDGKESLPHLLQEMGRQGSKAGIPEAKTIVPQVVDRQARDTLRLLHSVFGKVWTVELPPGSLNEIGTTLLPCLLVEDLSIADLYEDVEDFKKGTIYGFDSLAKFAGECRSNLEKALASPEKYQLISYFEPIRSRLVFAGRTEQVEKVVDSFGNLFICQTWSGYLDNLLSEVNLGLFAMEKCFLPSAGSLRQLKDGELAVLQRNTSALLVREESVIESLSNLKGHIKHANQELIELGNRVAAGGNFRTVLFDSCLQINSENLAHLPIQCENFGALSKELYSRTKKIGTIAQKELEKRKDSILRKKRRILILSLPFSAVSVILASIGSQMFTGTMLGLFVLGAILTQAFYWASYLLYARSFGAVGRFPSLNFRQAHFFTFAFTESLYKFTVATNVLTPIEPIIADSLEKKK